MNSEKSILGYLMALDLPFCVLVVLISSFCGVQGRPALAVTLAVVGIGSWYLVAGVTVVLLPCLTAPRRPFLFVGMMSMVRFVAVGIAR